MNTLSGIPIQFLNGVDGSSGNTLSSTLTGRIERVCQGVSLGLGALGGASEEVDLALLDGALYGYLTETRELLTEAPSTVAGYQRSPEDTRRMFDYALRYWNTDKKEEALDRLALLEKRETKSLSGIYGGDVGEAWATALPGVEYDPLVFEFDGSGRVRQRAGFWYNVGLAGKLLKKLKGAVKKVAQTAVKVVNAPVKAVATAAKAVAKTTVKAAKAVAKGTVVAAKTVAKGAVKVGKAVATAAKAVGKFIARYNPLSVMARTGLLVALKANLFGMSTRVAPAYLTEAQAAAEGFSAAEHNKAQEALGKVNAIFCGTLKGKESALRNAVLSGRRKKFKNPPADAASEQAIAQSVRESEAEIEAEFKHEVAEEERNAAAGSVGEQVNGALLGLLYGELGAVVAAGTAVSAAAATPFIVKVWNVVKGLGQKIGSGVKSVVSTTTTEDGTKVTLLDRIDRAADTAGKVLNTGSKVITTAAAAKAVVKGQPVPVPSTASSNATIAAPAASASAPPQGKSKLLLIGAGVAAAGAVGFLLYRRSKT